MKLKPKNRQTVKLNDCLDRKLSAYANCGRSRCGGLELTSKVAYALAGFVTLAFPHITLGEVVFTPTHQSVNLENEKVYVDINGDGVNDFMLSIYASSSPGSNGHGYEELTANGLQAGASIAVSEFNDAYAGVGGQKCGPGAPFNQDGFMARRFFHSAVSTSSGAWSKLKTRHFLGVKFLIDGETHYGWLRFSQSSARLAILTGYAYETVANKPIIAGLGDDGKALPEAQPLHPAGSLGRLAAGLLGMNQ